MNQNFAIMSVIMGVAGIASSIAMLQRLFWILSTKNWESASGKVTRSEIGTEYDRHQQQTIYVPHVEYEFRVRGQTHHGHVIHPASLRGCSMNSVCQRIIIKYPVGQFVTVYYDPYNPDDCCLDRSVTAANVVMSLICAALFLAMGILFPLYGTGILTL